MLRLSYDTFINSAFLMQGRADEFTVKPPNERKRVLGDILGLGHYDDMAERARFLARERGAEIKQVQQRLLDLDMRLRAKPELREEERAVEREDPSGDPGLQRSEQRPAPSGRSIRGTAPG